MSNKKSRKKRPTGAMLDVVGNAAVARAKGRAGDPKPWERGNSYTKGHTVRKQMENSRRPRTIKPTKRTGG